VIKERFSGRSKRIGFIEMPSNSEADQAIKVLNGNPVDGNTIIVRPANGAAKNDVRNDPLKEGVIESKQGKKRTRNLKI
jgi:RNA recognition motif-containing protein